MSAAPHKDVTARARVYPDPAIDTVPLPVIRPVFVDPSGRRRQRMRRLAVVGCGILGGYGVVMAAALLGAPLPQSILLPAPAQPSAQAPPMQAPPVVPQSVGGSLVPRAEAVADPNPSAPALAPAAATPTPTASAPAPAPAATTTSVPPGLARRGTTTAPGKK